MNSEEEEPARRQWQFGGDRRDRIESIQNKTSATTGLDDRIIRVC